MTLTNHDPTDDHATTMTHREYIIYSPSLRGVGHIYRHDETTSLCGMAERDRGDGDTVTPKDIRRHRSTCMGCVRILRRTP